MEQVRAAALYARISSDQEGTGQGVKRQLQDCRKLARELRWPVYDEYVDNDVSAFSGKLRPNYERMLEDVQAGEVDAVIVYNLDRLTRRPIEFEAFNATLAEAGVTQVRFVTGDVDLGTDDGLLYGRIQSAFAANESAVAQPPGPKKARPGGRRRPSPRWIEPTLRIPRRQDRPQGRRGCRHPPTRQALLGRREPPFADNVAQRPRSPHRPWRRVAHDNGGQLVDQPSRWPDSGNTGVRSRVRRSGSRSSRQTERPNLGHHGDQEGLGTPNPSPLSAFGIASMRQVRQSSLLLCSKDDPPLRVHGGPDHGGCGRLTVVAGPVEELIAAAVLLRLDTPKLAAALTGAVNDDAEAASLQDAVNADSEQLDELAQAYEPSPSPSASGSAPAK